MLIDRVYLDSCCFIEAMKHTTGVDVEENREDSIWKTKALLKASGNGDIRVVTSVFTLAECRKTKKTEEPDDEVKRLIDSILTSGKLVDLCEVTQSIARQARDLEWEHQINLSGADAIHVATALVLECKEFLTYDIKRKSPFKYKNELRALGLRVALPTDTTSLSNDYLQNALDFDESKKDTKNKKRGGRKLKL